MRESRLLPRLKAPGRVGRVPLWVFALGALLLYMATASGALQLMGVGPVATIWPPTALALAAFLLAGWWMLPVIILADLLAMRINGLPFMPIITIGNVLAPAIGAMVFRAAVSGSPLPQSLAETARMLFVVVPLIALITSAFGAAHALQAGLFSHLTLTQIAGAWWLGDVLGLAAFTPLFMALGMLTCGFSGVLSRRKNVSLAESIIVLSLVAMIGAIITIPWSRDFLVAGHGVFNLQLVAPILLVLFILMIWSALRLPSFLVFCVVPLATLSAIQYGLAELTSREQASAFLQWLVLLPTVLVMIVTTLLVEAGTRERYFLQRRLEFQSDHDPLTGLLNRRAFERTVRSRLEARIPHEPWLLAYLDLDQFQIVNDTLGHAAGDELLSQLAPRLENALGENDHIARLGGDEFGLVIEGDRQNEGGRCITRVREAIDAFRFTHSGKTFPLRASIGATELHGSGAEFGRLLSVADTACLAAKEQGRNQVLFGSGREITDRMSTLQHIPLIQSAIDAGRIELHGQDIIRMMPINREEHAIEILCRLRDEDGKLVYPDDFLPVAERAGLMPQLDQLIVECTLQWLETSPVPPDRCFINLSATSITRQSFVSDLLTMIDRRSIDPTRLVFEITESAAISHYDAARHLIDRLRSTGARIALDDFGSGMSSFGHLHELPIDMVKIDSLFIRNIGHRPMDEAIIQAIAGIGRKCGILTVAEGVEDAECLALLRTHGIDYVQGFHFSHPAPLNDHG